MTTKNPAAINQVFNTAVGDRTTIKEMAEVIKTGLMKYKKEVAKIPLQFGPERLGDVPHSQASIEKAKNLLNYNPTHNFKEGIEASLEWYYNNLKT